MKLILRLLLGMVTALAIAVWGLFGYLVFKLYPLWL